MLTMKKLLKMTRMVLTRLLMQLKITQLLHKLWLVVKQLDRGITKG